MGRKQETLLQKATDVVPMQSVKFLLWRGAIKQNKMIKKVGRTRHEAQHMAENKHKVNASGCKMKQSGSVPLLIVALPFW